MSTNVAALERLVRILETVPPENFDLEYWRNKTVGERSLLRFWRGPECHTTACAIGYACANSWFQAHGLLFAGGAPVYQDKQGFAAVSAFFGLDEDMAYYLFAVEHYHSKQETTPQQVIFRIQQVLVWGEDTWATPRPDGKSLPPRATLASME